MKAVSMLKGLLVTYLFTGILLVLVSLGLYKFGLSQKQVGIGIYVVYFLSSLFGGFLVGKMARTRKFLWGMAMGVLYFVVLFFISMGVNHSVQGSTMGIVAHLVLCMAGGMLGGMLA